MPSRSIPDKVWPRLNAKPDLFLVHRIISITPELYRPPDKSAWERLYEQYTRLSVVRHEQAVTFEYPVLRATPAQEAFWATCMPARPRPQGLWFGWGVELRESRDWNRFIIRGRFVIDGQLAVGGKVDIFEHITSEDIEAVTTHAMVFVNRLESVLLRTQNLTTASP
jgi:hypothetical protein